MVNRFFFRLFVTDLITYCSRTGTQQSAGDYDCTSAEREQPACPVERLQDQRLKSDSIPPLLLKRQLQQPLPRVARPDREERAPPDGRPVPPDKRRQ